MTHTIITRLFQSFTELERAIAAAKKTIEDNHSSNPYMMERVGYYEQMLLKQRELASSLCDHFGKSNWNEVNRHIKLINALSVMIKNDAEETLSGMRPSLSSEERAMMLS